jgi:hypothetical protein
MISLETRMALGLALFALSLQSSAQVSINIRSVEVGSTVQTRTGANSTILTHSTTQNIVSFASFNTTASGDSVRVQSTPGGTALYKVDNPVQFYGNLNGNGTISISGLGGLLFGGAGSSTQLGGITASNLVNTSGAGSAPSGVQFATAASPAQLNAISVSNSSVVVQAPGMPTATVNFAGAAPVNSVSLNLQKRELGF